MDHRRSADTLFFGVGMSLLLHIAAWSYVALSAAPDLGIELALPTDVEFGLTEAAEGGSPGTAQPETPATRAPETPAGAVGERAQKKRRGRRRRSRVPVAPGPAGSAGLPAGAQIAVRLHMARIRQSPLAPDVRRLLEVIPDWRAIIGGSGIDPLADLERLLIASPNLQRSRLLLAGEYQGGVERVREVVQRMAAERGEPGTFEQRLGVDVAPWPDRDVTPRVVALLGPRHFAITRPEDLPRLLAVASNRAEGGTASSAEALLSMAEGDALTLEVEGVARFVRRGDHLPSRFNLNVAEPSSGSIEVTAVGQYGSVRQAGEAQAFWVAARDGYARSPLARLFGLTPLLRAMVIEVRGTSVHVLTTLTTGQLRRLLGLARGLLLDAQRPRSPMPSSAPARPRAPVAPQAPASDMGARRTP